MKKLSILLMIIGLIGINSCQEKQVQKQYFQQSPEIEVAKKLVDSYVNQDWEAFRSCYSDTARIWKNVWFTSEPGTSVDESVAELKEFLPHIADYSYEETLWEMIVNNEGQKWVHFWGKWVGKLTDDGDEIEIPVHIAYGFIGDKIVYESGFWDNLPIYLAQQALETEVE